MVIIKCDIYVLFCKLLFVLAIFLIHNSHMKWNEPADAHKTDTFSTTPIAAGLCRVCERGFSIQLFELRLSSLL